MVWLCRLVSVSCTATGFIGWKARCVGRWNSKGGDTSGGSMKTAGSVCTGARLEESKEDTVVIPSDIGCFWGSGNIDDEGDELYAGGEETLKNGKEVSAFGRRLDKEWVEKRKNCRDIPEVNDLNGFWQMLRDSVKGWTIVPPGFLSETEEDEENKGTQRCYPASKLKSKSQQVALTPYYSGYLIYSGEANVSVSQTDPRLNTKFNVDPDDYCSKGCR